MRFPVWAISKVLVCLSLQFSLVLLLAWGLLSLSPFDPVNAYLTGGIAGVSVEQKANLTAHLGLELSAASRIWHWLLAMLQGDWGMSNLYHQSVSSLIAERLPVSLLLLGISWCLSLVFGYLLGLLSAIKQGKWLDHLVCYLGWTLAAIPSFWLGMLLLSLFAVSLHWLPACCVAPPGISFLEQGIWSILRHFLLPVLTLTLVHMVPVMLHTRAKVLDVLASDYVAYSRQHGDTTGSIVRFHVIKNSLMPALVLQFSTVAEIFGGSVLAENLFSFSGLGQALVKAALAKDISLFMACTLISALLVFLGNACANLCGIFLVFGNKRP